MVNTIQSNMLRSDIPASKLKPVAAANAADPSQVFIKLLVAQILNQDPLNPQDPGAFVSQLTQLNQLKAMGASSKISEANGARLERMLGMTLGSRVGNGVKVVTDTVDIGSEIVTGGIALTEPAAGLRLLLTGDNAQTHELIVGVGHVGNNRFVINPETLGLAKGRYAIEAVTASDERVAVEIHGTLNEIDLHRDRHTSLRVAGIGVVALDALRGFTNDGYPTSPNKDKK